MPEPELQKCAVPRPRSRPGDHSREDRQEENPSLFIHNPVLVPSHSTAFLEHHGGEQYW